MLFLISLDLGSIILPLVIFQTLTHFCVAGLKVMMVMGMVVVKMISFVFCQSQVQVEVPRSRTGRVGEWKEQPSFYGRG